MRILFLTWRDVGHPDGGGSEVFVEQVARGLVARGHDVRVRCARYPGSESVSVVDGVRFERAGGRLTVYPRGLLHLLGREGRRTDVVVDVINGLPFAARVVRRRGLVALVHHVHREQWHLIYPGLGGRVGWFVESRLTPRLYRSVPHLTVSESTRADLRALGIVHPEIRVVRNGLTPRRRVPETDRSSTPRLCVLARLVPHKRIEQAFAVVAALADEHPGLALDVIGEGWWRGELEAAAARLGVADRVVFHGHVNDDQRDRLLGTAWVALMPSVKEGWGIAATDAAAQGTPTVAYRQAGGVRESIQDGTTGVLVDDEVGLLAAVRALLEDPELRRRMSTAAEAYAATLTWEDATERVESLLLHVAADEN
ncbi:MAG: hypothetical protein JWO46_2507 [Nocardioidaceae bacterium]|nr:hypothetical protein [Nocardioidaceae bacterium]